MPSNITLQENEDGTFTAVYPWTTYRYLLDDGTTIDVKAILDGSHIREAVLAHTKAKRIEGVAIPGEKIEPMKKVPAKKAGRQRAVS